MLPLLLLLPLHLVLFRGGCKVISLLILFLSASSSLLCTQVFAFQNTVIILNTHTVTKILPSCLFLLLLLLMLSCVPKYFVNMGGTSPLVMQKVGSPMSTASCKNSHKLKRTTGRISVVDR